MPPVLVDERRLAAGLDGALAALVATAPREPLTPARFLARLLDARVLDEGERRAIVRRVAASRDVGIAPHVRRAPGFAQRVLAAVDGGGGGPYEALIDETRTLLAFANALDVPSALARAAGGAAAHGLTALAVDATLLEGDAAFAWRRVAAATGIAFEPLALPAPGEPVVDRVALDGVVAVLRFAQSGSDADARRAFAAPLCGVDPDEVRALLVVAGERSDLFDVVGTWSAGMVPGARESALGAVAALRAVAEAYRVPDIGASALLAEIVARFPVDAATAAALARVARAFDVARAFAPAWTADDLIAEITAELAPARDAIAPFDPSPAPQADREPASPVPLRLRPWSASSLGAYAACARKWYYRYVCAAVEDPGSSASFYGTAFHAALEAFHERFARFDGTVNDEAILSSALDACVGEAFERHRTRFDAPVEYELQRRRARRTARKYVRWLIERARIAPFDVLGNEVATDVELGGQRFVGFIDRLDTDRRTGTVTVVDYKTGSIATSAAEYLADVTALREFQLPFYYWARTAAGDRVTRLALIPLKDATLDVAPVELEIVSGRGGTRADGPRGTIGVAELERARDHMIALATRVASGAVEAYPVTSDVEACRYCAYADACRDRPVALEERFGR